MTDAVQVVVPPRWSETVTTPSDPVTVVAVVAASCEPSDTGPIGALIDNAPAVRVKVAGVPAVTAAPAGRANPTPKMAAVLTRSMNFRILSAPLSGGLRDLSISIPV